MGNTLENILVATSASTVTELFLWMMLAVFFIAILFGLLRIYRSFIEYAPSILVSLGILGTFIGIVIGLLNFEAQDIQNSISGLLEGLKTAFITSLAGMGLSIALKALDVLFFMHMRRAGKSAAEGISAEDIHKVMTHQADLLDGIKQSLSGQEEGSIIGQVRLLRSDIVDFRTSTERSQADFKKELFEQLENFAQMLSKSATETVINALKEVIQDFNKHLVEQFGDNFKELNQSVVRMIDWQDEYKNHIEQLEHRFEIAVNELERTAIANESISQSLAQTEQSINSIDQHCESIPQSIEQLRPVLDVNQNQIERLQEHLEVFAKMRERAVEAVPELQEHMNQLSKQFSEQVGQIMTTMHEGAMEFGTSVDRTNSALTEAAHVVSTKTEEIGQNITEAANDFSGSIREMFADLQNNAQAFDNFMQRTIEEFSTEFNNKLSRLTAEMSERFSTTIEHTMDSMRSGVEQNLQHTQQSIYDSGDRTLRAVEKQVSDAVQEANRMLEAQLQAMDNAIRQELEMVFREMGSALATISRQIADDHAELVRRMNA